MGYLRPCLFVTLWWFYLFFVFPLFFLLDDVPLETLGDFFRYWKFVLVDSRLFWNLLVVPTTLLIISNVRWRA